MANSIISPDRFNDLKAKVKAECKRRAYVGSVTDYAGTAYDYTNTPTSKNVISKEHYEKIAVPLNAISSDMPIDGARIISEAEMATMETKATTLAAISLNVAQANTGCAASCTGLCSTGCYDACTGCSGCGGSCSYSCSSCGGCDNGCSGSCVNGCAYDCTGTCIETCRGTCSTACALECGSNCSGSCNESCWSTTAGGGSCTGSYCTAMCMSSSV